MSTKLDNWRGATCNDQTSCESVIFSLRPVHTCTLKVNYMYSMLMLRIHMEVDNEEDGAC